MTGIPEENTLGIVVGNAARAVSKTARRIGRAGARPGLGSSFLALGADILVVLRSLYGIIVFIGLWSLYPAPAAAASAWGVLLVVIAGTIIGTRLGGDRMPTWAFLLVLCGLAAAVALDVVAVWELHDLGRTLTAATAAGTTLLLVVTHRGATEVLVAAGVLGATLVALIFFNTPPGTPFDSDHFAPALATIAFAVLPAIIGVVVVHGYRQMVQLELDRVLVQSNVSAPRFAVGMLASEELARLDLAAERLLDSIATKKTALPLTPKTASLAASLATELRLHLIEGRRETWLYHAVSESEMLGKSVTLVDKSSLAGLLDPTQRDGLLSTAWLLVSDTRKKSSPHRTVTVQVGPLAPSPEARTDRKIVIPIRITSTGISRNRVDPAIWAALGRVGRYSDSTEDGSLRVDIETIVDNPADV
ncbi:hypothetical protein [Protaetiibacter intestinalis]|uniref:Uncharacterized protein n=1 Tax=Protaetiibacter intestinalis TaxID=2419774 RepID=A0A387BCB9_9MICO|nr:hypothetical protein [Protaetiibacter intestinalis]AYF98745.1 hypothetical protein D7I47_11125 [Protaetiibacter intestinalis]